MELQARRESWFEHVRRAQRQGRSVAAYARSIQVPPRVGQIHGQVAPGTRLSSPHDMSVAGSPAAVSPTARTLRFCLTHPLPMPLCAPHGRARRTRF
jgi:hypothetical protein